MSQLVSPIYGKNIFDNLFLGFVFPTWLYTYNGRKSL